MTREEALAEVEALSKERMEGLRLWCRAMRDQLETPRSGPRALLPYQGQTTPGMTAAAYAEAIRRLKAMLNTRDRGLADRALAVVTATGVVPVP